VGIALSAAVMIYILTRVNPELWLLPAAKDILSPRGIFDGIRIHGSRPVILHDDVRIALTCFVLIVLSGFAAGIFAARPSSLRESGTPQLAKLLVLVVPFSLVYILVIATQDPLDNVFQRYLLPLLFLASLVLARFYQDRIGHRLPGYVPALIAIVAAFSIAATHDAFAMFRAWQTAADHLKQSGVPPESIDVGAAYALWTELQFDRYIHGPLTKYPAGFPVQNPPTHWDTTCAPQMWRYAPHIHPKYTLSFEPDLCSGLSNFPPVRYHQWLGPRTGTIYILRNEPGPRNDGWPSPSD